ncbi:hypothetical protein PybrP1_011526 [[Pythium] brassicae (nom. inval.)]|nr:hypothetical protein PybrP1_011526 [[Pythium] brassicae (nom. inval.)]
MEALCMRGEKQPRWSRSSVSTSEKENRPPSRRSRVVAAPDAPAVPGVVDRESNSDSDSDDDAYGSDADDEEFIFMALLYDRKRLGVAIYDVVTTGLKTLEIAVSDKEELKQVLPALSCVCVYMPQLLCCTPTAMPHAHVYRVCAAATDCRATAHAVPSAQDPDLIAERQRARPLAACQAPGPKCAQGAPTVAIVSATAGLQRVVHVNAVVLLGSSTQARRAFDPRLGACWLICLTSVVGIPDFNYLKACQSIEGTRIGKNWTDYNVSLADISRRDAYKYIGKFFDFESIQLIRATGDRQPTGRRLANVHRQRGADRARRDHVHRRVNVPVAADL